MKIAKILIFIALSLVIAFGIFVGCKAHDGLTVFISYGFVLIAASILCSISIGMYYGEKELPYEEIIYRSNVIQFDEMGSPLRLCIVRTKKKPYTDQVWLDTTQRPNDVVLEWEKNDEINTNKH